MSVYLREENKKAVRPVFPLLMSMAIPPMISMLIQSLYTIVDSMFVAKIGEDALTAVSLAFPVQTLIVACSVGIGVGVNSYISRSLGREDQVGADSAVAHGLLMAAFWQFCSSSRDSSCWNPSSGCSAMIRQSWQMPSPTPTSA